MKQYDPQHIRNVVLIGHGHSGKTSLAESLLWTSRTTTRLGRIEDGNTVSDFDPDEIKRHMSISTALVPLEWRDTKINILDTPGTSDFVGEVCSALSVAETAVLLVDASAGVEVGTEQLWARAAQEGLARIIFINKMDRENADFDRAFDACRAAFGSAVAPLEIPIGAEKNLQGTVDILCERAYTFDQQGARTETEIPADMAETVAAYRSRLVEAICELDEELMMRYLEDETISTEELQPILKGAVARGELFPVLSGSATRSIGTVSLLDALVDYAPNAARAVEAESGETLEADPTGPAAALVFKTIADPHVGRVSYFRVYSGAIRGNGHLHNSTRGQGERIGHVFLIRGKEHLPADSVSAGDIGAVGKLAVTLTNDCLCADGSRIRLKQIAFPGASYAASVHPKTKSDLDKMSQALNRLLEEDPTLRLSRDAITGEAILEGMGEPHVQIALERMTRRFGVHVEAGLPRVAYRETITQQTRTEYKHKKQTGGAGQYGHVIMELEPLEGAEFEFAERVVGGSVPRNFFPAVEKGVQEAMAAGPVAGYPVVNIKATLVDGSYHDVDSNEMAFKIAAKEAFKKGVLQAKPVLLEPVLTIHVTVPDSFTGDIMSDLNGKRAHVSGMTPGASGLTTIDATVPAAEVQRYATDLRSITQGRGSFTAEFSHYQPVPHNVAEQIKAAAQTHAGAAA